MNAMTLLRAVSELPPEMLEAAMNAGKAGDPEEPAADGAVPVIPNTGRGEVIFRRTEETPRRGRFFRISGLIAAAACMVLTLGIILHFRQNGENGLVLMSDVSVQIEEITGTEPPQTTAYTTADLALTAQSAATTTEPQITAQTNVQLTTDAAESTAAQTETAAETETEPEITETEAVTTTAVTYAENVPVLVAMGDGMGVLDTAYTWETVTDKAAIDAYLNGKEPVVTLGTGQKSEEITEKITENCTMLRIRWQKGEPLWSSYGITGAELDENGVLHLSVAMYADRGTVECAEWVYETALLYQSGTLPDITDVKLELTHYEDTDGIAEWLAYTQILQEDVYIRTAQ